MARNIYSPLMISSISFFVLFIIVIAIFTSTRLNEDYITKQVNKNKAMVSSLKSKTDTAALKPSPPPQQINKRKTVNSYNNVMPIQRRG